MSLNIYLLGQFRLQVNDQPIELPSRPAQSLLAYLVLSAGVTHRREKLAYLLWPDATESNARGYLRQALWRIRKALESVSLSPTDYLHISDISLTFDDQADYWLDAQRLLSSAEARSVDELIEILDLYRGELLPGFYDEWVVPERDRLQTAYHQKMNLLLDCLIQAGEWEDALKWSEHWVRLGYSPEPAFRAMMRSYAGLGDQGMVSATYQRCTASLERELGLGASPETHRLYEHILMGELFEPPPSHAPTFSAAAQLPSFLGEGEAYPVEQPIFVAREFELAQLAGFLDKALEGRGRFAFITGEAGSGKTALLQEFTRRAQVDHTDLVVAGGNCNAHTGIGDPYLPFREILELLTGDVEARWAAGAITRDHARRLWNTMPLAAQALVEVGPDLIDAFVPGAALVDRCAAWAPKEAEWLQRLAALGQRRRPGTMVPVPGQIDISEQFTRVLQALAHQVPLVLVIDDLQWADLGSISLLFHLGRNLAGCRMLIIGAYRPVEVALGRDGERHPLDSVINELQRVFGDLAVNVDQAESWGFMEAWLDSEPNCLGRQFRDLLFRQTRGHPLFTIELLRGMLERGDLVLGQDGLWGEGPALDWERLPARVEAVVAERISRLDPSLQTALSVASVEGETFTIEVVMRVLAKDENNLAGRFSVELDRKHRLISAHSIQRINGQLISNYRFRHILAQRYLYSRLNEVERVHLHEQIGTHLEALYGARENATGEDIAMIAPQLARHFQEAKLIPKAINYLRQAGERAVYLSAYLEGVSHLSNGLSMLFTLPDSPARDELELELQRILGLAWMGSVGGQAIEVEKALTRAYELCQLLGKTSQLSQVAGNLSTFHYVRAEYQMALKQAQIALSQAKQAEDPLLVAVAHWYNGYILFCLGEFTQASKHLEEVVTFYDPQQHHNPFLSFCGSDAGLGALAYAACCLWCLGYPDQAMIRSQKALVLAGEINHPFSQADVICYAGCLFNAMRRDAVALKDHAEQLIGLVNDRMLTGWLGSGLSFRADALAMLGDFDEGIAQLLESIADMRSSGIRLYLPGTLGFLAEAQAKTGQPEVGLKTLEEALSLVEQSDESLWEPEIHRLRAELLLLLGDQDEAENSFIKAIEVARRQRARSWELRAAIGLARFWLSAGKRDEAREALSQIYGWFSEGFDTPDLIEAKALLDRMS